jgi:hypothetical protein
MPQPWGRRRAGFTPQKCSIHIRTPLGALAPGVFDDFDRVFDHTHKSGDPAAATQRIDEIIKAVDVPTHSPLIGRKVKGAQRDLVIGRASRG